MKQHKNGSWNLTNEEYTQLQDKTSIYYVTKEELMIGVGGGIIIGVFTQTGIRLISPNIACEYTIWAVIVTMALILWLLQVKKEMSKYRSQNHECRAPQWPKQMDQRTPEEISEEIHEDWNKIKRVTQWKK